MTFIREFKVILPVQEDSILSAALENMFNVTDASQVSIYFTPIDRVSGYTEYKFDVSISYFDRILEHYKKLSKAIVYMTQGEYNTFMSGVDDEFIISIIKSLFIRFPDIMADQEFISNL